MEIELSGETGETGDCRGVMPDATKGTGLLEERGICLRTEGAAAEEAGVKVIVTPLQCKEAEIEKRA